MQETHPPTCGSDGTPPCPGIVVTENRQLLINLIAGPKATPERRELIAAEVDQYLASALVSAITLHTLGQKAAATK